MSGLGELTSLLYKISRTAGSAASKAADCRDIVNNDPQKLLKRKAKSSMHKVLNQALRGMK